MERSHAPREDSGRRRALGAGGIDEPQSRELDGELGARCGGRGREVRSGDGAIVRGGPRECNGDRSGSAAAPGEDPWRRTAAVTCAGKGGIRRRDRRGNSHREQRERGAGRPARAWTCRIKPDRCPRPRADRCSGAGCSLAASRLLSSGARFWLARRNAADPRGEGSSQPRS